MVAVGDLFLKILSMLTDKATRVTLDASADNRSTVELMVPADIYKGVDEIKKPTLESRISPSTGISIFCVRSPLVTAVVTTAIDHI